MPQILAFSYRCRYKQYILIAKESSARKMSLPNSSLLSTRRNPGRPVSVPPDGSTLFSFMSSKKQDEARSSSIPPPLTKRHAHSDTINRSGFSRSSSRDRTSGTTSLDLMDVLQRSEPSVVKTRSGSVLSRGMILKTDHYPSGMYLSRILLSRLIGHLHQAVHSISTSTSMAPPTLDLQDKEV